jgi:rhodanese-related sulfurtransferase
MWAMSEPRREKGRGEEHRARELKEKMDRGDDFVLVDTLAEKYYRHSHLPGAINLQVDQVGERAPELVPDKDAEIVVYCLDPP